MTERPINQCSHVNQSSKRRRLGIQLVEDCVRLLGLYYRILLLLLRQ